MINYIIALTLHARRNNVSSLVWDLFNFHFHRWYYLHHEFILDWLCVHSWTQTLCIKQGESDLYWPWFCSCHDVSPHFSSVKAGRQQMWVRWQEFVWVVHVLHLVELSSSSLLNYIASPENLPCGYCVAAPFWHFDQQRSWWSYNDATTLTYLIFHWQQSKLNTIIESFLCWNSCIWVLHCYITSLLMFCINDFTKFYVFH